MSLRGNLEEFSIAEVFQILSLGRKTGVLRIINQAEGFIYFRGGEAYYAVSTRYRKPIGQKLVEDGLIDEKDLTKALDAQKREAGEKRLGRMLLDMGLIDTRALESLVKEQIWDALVDILSWNTGDFEFESGKLPAEEDIGITLEAWNKVVCSIPSFENVIKSELWVKIKEAIPSFDIVFALSRKRGAEAAGISLAPSEWSLLCLIDGIKTVEDLLKECGKDNFHVNYILYKLIKAELIKQVGSASASSSGENPQTKKSELDKKHTSRLNADKTLLVMAKPESAEEQITDVGREKASVDRDKKQHSMKSGSAKSEPRANQAREKKLSVSTPSLDNEVKGQNQIQESKKKSEQDSAGEQDSLISVEVKSLGSLEVWTGKEKRFADLFIIKTGGKASNILRFPDGKYKFVNDCFSPEEKKAICEKISLAKKEKSGCTH